MVKKKRKVKDRKRTLHLTCQECGHKFMADRFRKYCIYKCQRKANNRYAKNRYADNRDIVLRARGDIE